MRVGLALFFTIITTFLFISPSVNGQTIDKEEIVLELKNETLVRAFRKIEAQSPFHFMYRNADVKDITNLNISSGKRTVAAFLEEMLRNTSLDYRQLDNRILITVSDKDKNKVLAETGHDEIKDPDKIKTGSIRGKVIDSKGLIMHGVSIQLGGTLNQSQSSDNQGNFSFTNLLPGVYSLSFSFLGFSKSVNTLILREGELRTLNNTLTEETRNLGEIVIVAYGSQKKTSLTTAVSSLQGETIANIPVANFSNAFGGRLTGLITRQGSGEPGNDDADMYIRGISSTGNNQPLLVVDGIPRSFNQLDPQTIETITVLKDAAAAAPYGVAGANGVVLVTTRMGKSGTPSLTFNSSFGIQNLNAIPELPSSFEFASLKNAASINEGLLPPYSASDLQKFKIAADPDRYPNTNAHDVMIDRNTPLITNTLQMSGGADRFKYYASVGYMFQQGVFKPINVNRYTLSLNMEGQVTGTTTVSLKLNTRQQDNSYSGIRTADLFAYLNYAHPTNPIFWTNGEAATFVYPMVYESGSNTSKTTQIFSQLSVDQRLSFIPGLSVKGTIAYDPGFSLNKLWIIPTHVWTADFTSSPYTFKDAIYGNTKASLSQSVINPKSLTFQGSLNFNHTAGKSDISALALFEARSTQLMSLSAGRVNYNLLVDELSLGSSDPLDISNSGSSNESRQLGLVYRLTYAWAGKYLAEATGRYDGHYYFAPGKRFGFFPAASVGWRISEENFLKQNLPFITNLKIRASYGEVGALAGAPFQYLNTFNVNSNAAVLNGTAVQGISERPEANPNITWERAKKSNIGLEASFWNDLLIVEADYFYGKRSNMLVNPTVITPLEYGVGLSQVNGGKMKNQGYELTVGSRYSVSSDLQLSFNANITHARNTLLQIFETPSTLNNPNRRQTGRSLGTQFGYDALGFYLPEDFTADGILKNGVVSGPTTARLYPGDLKYRDINGDLKINNEDLVPIGDPSIPQIMYGLNPNIRFKSFQLDLLFQGTYKRDFYLSDWAVWPFNVGRGAYKHNLDYWRPDNTNARNPRVTNAPAANNTVVSSWWMNDASYLRLKNLQLTYSLPSHIIEKMSMRSLKINLSAQNLKTWSKMKYDYDPESSIVLGGYPPVKVISAGLTAAFK